MIVPRIPPLWPVLLASVLNASCGSDIDGPPMEPDTWTIAVLPDTQIYAREYPEIFEAQTLWIAENSEARHIRFVLHEGDVVDDNSDGQWMVAERALRILDGVVPYVLVPGNHDYGVGGSADTRDTQLTHRFPVEELRGRATFGGLFDETRIDNSYHVFETPEGPYLVLGLEFGPRDEVVTWADSVLEDHASLPAVLLTHAYLYSDDTRYDAARRPDQRWSPHSYGLATDAVNDGEALWQSLVSRHSNIHFVLSGHVLNDGLGRLTSRREDGTVVHQMLANYQMNDLGGEGYLRLLEIKGDTVTVRTYSPWLGASKTDPDNEFILTFP